MSRSNGRFLSWIVAAIFLAILGSTEVCLAQSDTARLQGTVTDPQDAAIAGANVQVANTGTGFAATVTTSELGFYSVSALPPGSYRVEVSQKGFKKVVRELELQVAQVGVADFKLEVGDVTQSITVESGSPVIDSADSAIGQVMEGRQATELPLNGRNFTQLAL